MIGSQDIQHKTGGLVEKYFNIFIFKVNQKSYIKLIPITSLSSFNSFLRREYIGLDLNHKTGDLQDLVYVDHQHKTWDVQILSFPTFFLEALYN